jgi:hypothetical protein
MPRAKVAAVEPADNAAAKSGAKSDAKSDTLPDKAGGGASSGTRTIQEQVAAATALAEFHIPRGCIHFAMLGLFVFRLFV